jgi:hypothetical protein
VSPDQSIGGVSCPSTSVCVAFDSAGNVLSSIDPTGRASAWTKTTVEQGAFVDAVSCASVSLCVATTGTGDIFTSTNPTGGASAWTKATVDPGGSIDAISCPSVSLCIAAGGDAAEYSNGIILTSTNPTGGAGAWAKATIDPGATHFPVALDTLSCASVSLCIAGDGFNIFSSTDPTGRADDRVGRKPKVGFDAAGGSGDRWICANSAACDAFRDICPTQSGRRVVPPHHLLTAGAYESEHERGRP